MLTCCVVLGCDRIDTETVSVAGRVQRRAIQGKLYFYDLTADGAKVQIDSIHI